MKTKILQSIICAGLLYSNLNATSLRDTVEQAINTNPDIIAEHFNQKAFHTNIDEQQGDYYPTLDFSTYVEKSHTYNDKDTTGKDDAGKDGWNAALKFEQVIYDGGQTPNEVELYKHRYNSIKYTSNETVENLILDVVNVYTNIVSYQELIALDNLKIKIHNDYLKLAKEKEELSGEALDRILVSSKIKSIMDNYLEQEVNQQKAFSQYKKLSGNKLNGNVCRPIINNKLIPTNLEEAIEIALRKNNKIHAQKETIREQVSRLNIEDSKFRPSLKLQVEANLDNDLKLPENGQQDIYRVRLQSDWNLYNGGKDTLTAQRERITILEQKKILDSIKDEVIDEIKGSYNTFFKIKKRILNLKEFIIDNQNIVKIYTSQLQDGSRTFIDVLNAEAELFRTKVLLIELEFNLYNEYYNILKSLNVLSDSILSERKQVCNKYVFVEPKREEKAKEKTEAELENELSDELGLE